MATNTTPAAAKRSQQPPDERFWVKYSRHHELPISSMASLTWHVLVGVLIVVVGFIVARSRSNDMPIETVEVGGGGNPNGVGNGPGIGGAPMVEAAAQQPPADAIRAAEPLVENVPLQIAPKDLLPGIEDDPDAQRELVKITERGNQALRKLEKLDADFRKSLLGPPGQGRGGPGSGGGSGTGAGRGDGDGSGSSGKINTRTQRQLRWTLTFNIRTGSDYLRQLDVLHAILAFRHPDGSLKVVKNLLQRPLKLEDDDVKGLNRIFWIDDDPASVDKMARALGLEFTPREFVALFPHEFEDDLAKKERSYRNRREDQIFRTRFAVTVLGNGHSVVVAEQIPNGQ
jgi:hypothetical protein